MVEASGIRRGRGIRQSAGVSAALCIALAGTALAQTTAPQVERDVQRPGSATESTVRGSESQRESLGPASTFQGRDVTFDEVLRDPDNVDLNYAYALTLIRQGDLLGALSTLERILLRNPNIPRVRLLYAIVLYRLNAVDEASRELDNVLKLQMDGGLRRELEYYRSEVARAKLFATENASWVCDRAVQHFGGLGVKRGVIVERLYRDVRALRIYEGTSEIQKLVLAKELLG